MPHIPLLHCLAEYDDLSRQAEDFSDQFIAWSTTEKDLYQGRYQVGLLLDVSWYAKAPDSGAPFFRISVARAAPLDWEELVVSWICRDMSQLRAALTLLDGWCVSWRVESRGTPTMVPKLRNKVERDSLSAATWSADVIETAASAREVSVATYPTGLEVRVDWQVSQGLRGAWASRTISEASRGFKIRLINPHHRDWPTIRWAAETFEDLRAALSAIDQWVHVDLRPGAG